MYKKKIVFKIALFFWSRLKNAYSPDQDPFGDQDPAYGYFLGYSFEYERIPNLEID